MSTASFLLDVKATFCYLGDMLCSSGVCDSAWGKFRELLPVLTTRHHSSKVRSKVYMACVCSVMFHGSKTWGPHASDLQQLHHNDCDMIHWIWGTNDWDETPSASLLQELGIDDIRKVIRSRQLRWYVHVQRATSCIKSVTDLAIPALEGEVVQMCQNWYQ